MHTNIPAIAGVPIEFILFAAVLEPLQTVLAHRL